MYEYFKGILVGIRSNCIIVEVEHIGYLLHVANPYAYSNQVGTQVKIYVHQVVREDAHLMYGFQSQEEKELFLQLISVSGIGPVSALAIIAVDDHEGLVQAITDKNITYLSKFPKIGKKTAQQMVLDLEGKMSFDAKRSSQSPILLKQQDNPALEEAMEAMVALGYKASELKKIKTSFEGTTDTTENYIKSALKMLVK